MIEDTFVIGPTKFRGIKKAQCAIPVPVNSWIFCKNLAAPISAKKGQFFDLKSLAKFLRFFSIKGESRSNQITLSSVILDYCFSLWLFH